MRTLRRRGSNSQLGYYQCKFDAISLEKKFDGKMISYEESEEAIQSYAALREQKIEERKQRDQRKN